MVSETKVRQCVARGSDPSEGCSLRNGLAEASVYMTFNSTTGPLIDSVTADCVGTRFVPSAGAAIFCVNGGLG